MKNIKTIQELAAMLNNETSLFPGSSPLRFFYKQQLINGVLDKKHFTDLCASAVPHILILFPTYPQATNFIQWVQDTNLDSEQFYKILVMFIKTSWTEERYPERVSERFFILRQIAIPARLRLSWIFRTSKKAELQEPWVYHDIWYLYRREDAMYLLVQLCSTENFVDNLIIRMPQYVNDFSATKMEIFFESWGNAITGEQCAELREWFRLFAAETYKMM